MKHRMLFYVAIFITISIFIIYSVMNKNVSTTSNGTSTSNTPTKGTPTSTPTYSTLSTSTPTKSTPTNRNLYTLVPQKEGISNTEWLGEWSLDESNKEKVQPSKNDYLNKDSLCFKNEEQYFGFTVAGNNKLLSICVSNKLSYLVYRYGQHDHIELEYPNNKEDSWNSFNYSYYLRGGGTTNSGLDLNYLSFNNGNFKYELFEEYNADNAETHIGIHVADKNTNKVTTIEGIEKMKIGSLVKFRGSKLKEILFDK